jgi:hypothetical protein
VKISVIGVPEVPLGKRPVKDPRLDQAHKLVEADKKVYAQVDTVSGDDLLVSDAVVVARDQALELVFQDLELIESRMGRQPSAAEKAALEKLTKVLETEQPVFTAALTAEEKQALGALNFATGRPVIAVDPTDVDALDEVFVRAVREAGYITFLTVGGKENRAWLVKAGSTAWDAAGAIHTDIQKGFIRAEIIGWDDFVAAGGETQAKRAGKQRLEVKTYVMQDYDLVNFRFSK